MQGAVLRKYGRQQNTLSATMSWMHGRVTIKHLVTGVLVVSAMTL